MRLLILLLTAATMTNFSSAQTPQSPDLIFVNGDVYTGTVTTLTKGGQVAIGGAVELGRVQAFAVGNGKISATGSNEEIQKLKGPATKVVDLGGHFVMPAFNDAHTHLASAGSEKLNVDLVGVKSLDEMKQRIAAHAKQTAPGDWVLGGGWDHTLWTGQRLPTREDIDAVTTGHPAIFSRVDGHISIANSAALKAAGITAQTPDPHGGKIDHDAKGEPAGILRETARDAVFSKVPPPNAAQRRRGIELALADAAQWGVTSAQDNSAWEDFLVCEQLEKEGKLTLRISEWLPFDASLEKLKAMRAHHAANDPMLHTAMLKGFMDGSLGSRTAAMLAPYSDDPKNSGLPRYEQEPLNQKTAERLKAGFQIGFHAIGDRANRMALEAFVSAMHSVPILTLPQFRFRIEHAQVVAPEDFKKFKELRVIASMQPNHLLTDMNWAESRLGADRAKHSYAWKEFLDDGVTLAFGTDYPVEPITPFRGLYAAVTRKNEAGTKEYFPEQKISIHQAIAAYTTGAAYAQFAENEKGSLRPGMLADFVVLDRDITKVPASEILKTRVLRTVVGGQTVYEAK